MALLGVMLVPLFVSTWRASLLGLATQGLLMAWIASRLAPFEATASDAVTLFDLVFVRGIAVPLMLARVLKAQQSPPRNHVIPPNLLSWTLALGMVIAAFRFAELLEPEVGDHQTLVAVSAAGVMLAFLVLSSQGGAFSQMVGVLRLENAIALLELGASRHHATLGIQLAVLAAYVITVLLFRRSLVELDPRPSPGDDVDVARSAL